MLTPFKQTLRTEIAAWLEEQLISEEQAQKLYSRYELDAAPPWYLRSGFILSGVAIVLVAMGFFLLISANWEHLPLWARVSVGALPLAIAYGIGFWQEMRKQSEGAELAFFLGSLFFGLNIFLQAQIFHIEAYYPNGVLWWAIGVAPVALYYRSSLHNLLLMTLFVIWTGMQMQYNQYNVLSIPLLGIIGYLMWIRPTATQLIAGIAVWCFALWNIHVALFPHINGANAAIYWLAVALSAAAWLPFIQHQYSHTVIALVRQLVAFAVLLPLFMLTYENAANSLLREIPAGWSYAISGGLLLITAVLYGWKSRTDYVMFWLIGIAVAIWGMMLIFREAQAEVFRYCANAIFLAYAIWRIAEGLRQRVKSLFMTGVSMILVLALARYFDLIEDYTTGSILFMLFGGGIFAINRYWNKRYQS